MTPEEQRIAIAKAIGWEQSQTSAKACWDQHGASCYWSDAPDYLHDLNAMHEAEKVLNREQLEDYEWELVGLRGENFAYSTASERARAFLKATGKWEESP
jgi:hypothetical protein